MISQMESVRCLLGGGGVEKVTMVFDMTGFGLRNMDWRCLLFMWALAIASIGVR